jgi:glycosyltransferase involved in cell wall biosynthesis
MFIGGNQMSFVINVYENETLKYWKMKLKGKWYKYPFLMLKNLEIETFQKNVNNIEHREENKEAKFTFVNVMNNVNIDSSVMVVIPVYVKDLRGRMQIERTIQLLKKQTIKPKNIIIVDDCSPVNYCHDGTEFIKVPINQGPANARNIGINKAIELGADIISFTDSDVLPSLNWIECVLHSFISNKFGHLISGKTISYNKNLFGLYHDINGTLNGRKFKDSDLLLYGPTCNLSIVSKALINKNFSTDFPLAAGEDIHLCFVLLSNGYNILHDPSVIVRHDYGYRFLRFKENKKAFVNMFVKYSRGESILLNKIPDYYSYLNKTIEISNKK